MGSSLFMCGDLGRGVSDRIESTIAFIAERELDLFPPAPMLLLNEFCAEKIQISLLLLVFQKRLHIAVNIKQRFF